jgi:hypothetical protein
MKMNKRILSLPGAVLILIVLSILVAPVAAKTIRTDYEGVELYVGPLSPGRQWVSEEGILHIRGGQEAYRDEVSDPRVSGDAVVTLNVNFQFAAPPVMVYGPMWGEFRIDNDGGYWEGTWVGERTEQGFSYIRGVLHGHGGYDGLQARAEYVRESPDPTAPFAVHGVVMEPGGD